MNGVRWLLLLLVLTHSGCPGKRRPPPWAKTARSDAQAEEAREPPPPPPPLPRTFEEQLRDLRSGLTGLRAQKRRFDAGSRTSEERKRLIAEMKALETRGNDLYDQIRSRGGGDDEEETEDERRVRELLERIGELRSDIVAGSR